MIRKWVQMFNEGRENVQDEARSGRPSLVNDNLVRKVNERRFTVSDLSLHFPQISRLYSTTLSVVIWVIGKCVHDGCPRCSQRSTKKHRVACALTFLMRYHKERDDILSHIVTGDETWVSHITPESKQQSLHWKHTGSPKRKNFKQTFSTRKIMCNVFWDRQGVLLLEFLPQGTTINSAVYCETLNKLRRVIQNKRRGMLSATILLLHDNARPHSTAQTQNLITSFKWEQMDHPPYSPDLAPSDYHLFLHLKKLLGGKRFDDDNGLKDAVQNWLTSQAAAFLEKGMQKLVPRYDKCLNNGGEYVEK